MTQMKVTYTGNLKTEAVHHDSGSKLVTAAPKDNNGDGSTFSPTDLLCTSLASCKLTIMAIKARALEVPFEGVEVAVQKIMTPQPPRKIQEIVLTFNWNGLDQKITPEQMESLKRSAKQCPVALSLDPSVKQTVNW
jgi:putative redox protein